MKLNPEDINHELIEDLIMRCYAIDHTLRVTDSDNNWAQLKYGVYSYETPVDNFSGRVSIGKMQTIFSGLIAKYKNFEYQGVTYHYGLGEWRVVGFD